MEMTDTEHFLNASMQKQSEYTSHLNHAEKIKPWGGFSPHIIEFIRFYF